MLYTPTLSGGSWEAGLPLTNLQDRRLHRVARSTDAAVASTVFTVDLGTDRAVRLVAIPKHNISAAGTVRARGFLSVPVLDSLTVGDAAWTAEGTPTRTAAAFTAPDGVPMDLIDDDDGAANEGYYRTVSFTGDGTKVCSQRIKAGTASESHFGVYDNTAGTWRHRVRAAWSGGVPTCSSAAGTGTILATTALGDGVYHVVYTVTGVVAANVNRYYVRGATNTASSLGSTYYADTLAWNATADQQVYDSGYTSPWPSGWDAETTENLNLPWLAIAGEDQTARYWRVNIADSTNPDGYVDLGRLVVAGGFQPQVNMAYGAGLGFDNETVRETTEGGAALYDTRPTRRTLTGVLDLMPETDAYDEWFRLVTRHGLSGQLFVVYDPDDAAARSAQRSFLAVLRQLNPIEHPYHVRFRTAFSLIEEL